MSAIVFDKVWKEYGDHIVLEQIDLEIEPRAFLVLVGPPDAARRRSCACFSARSSRRAARSCWTASR